MPCALVISIRTFEELLISVKNAAPQGCKDVEILSDIAVIVSLGFGIKVFLLK